MKVLWVALMWSTVALAQKPSVGLLIREDAVAGDGGIEHPTDFQDAFAAALTEAGWTVVTPASGTLSGAEAGKLDFVLMGSVGSKRLSGGQVAVDANLQLLKAAGTREVIWNESASKKASGKSFTEAYGSVAKQAASELVSLLGSAATEREGQEATQGRALVIKLRGAADFSAVQKVKKALGALPKVKEVSAGSLKNGESTFEVSYDGAADELLRSLSSADWKGPAVTAKKKDEGTLELAVKN